MRIKLDENLGSRGAGQLRAAGHDVQTVKDQDMCSTGDRELIAACMGEKRCLVSLDLDFANPLLFRPSTYAGIAVLRLPPKPTAAHLSSLMATLIEGLKNDPITGQLWIIESRRIRVYQEDQEGDA